MTVQTFNTLTGNFNSHGGTGVDNNAVPEAGTAKAEDHTRVDSINMAQQAPNTEVYFKHAVSERQISAAEAHATNAIVSIGGMQTDFRSAVAAGLITDTGEKVGAQPARTEPAPQPTGENHVDVGDTKQDAATAVGESESIALGIATADIGADALTEIALRSADGDFDFNDLDTLANTFGDNAAQTAAHLRQEGLNAFRAEFGETSDMLMDTFYHARDTQEVHDAIAAFLKTGSMSGFRQLVDII